MVPRPLPGSAAFLPSTTVRGGGKGGHSPGSSKQGKPSSFLSTETTNFSVLLRDAYVGDNGAFVLALFLSALFTAMVTLLSQAARRAEYSVLARRPRPALRVRAAAAFVHGVRLFMLYIAVMVAMTRNLWLVLAMVLGHMLGWLVFSTVATPRPAGDEAPDAVFDDDDDLDDATKRKPSEVA